MPLNAWFPLQLKDKYGSPSLDEVSLFSREFYNALEAKIGEQAAGELSVEVSSPVSPLPSLSPSISVTVVPSQRMARPEQACCPSLTYPYALLVGSFLA